MADPKNIANPSAEASNIGYMADRSAPNWGKTAPLPELEGVINLLNQLRAEPRYKEVQWEKARNAAYAKAARLLEIQPSGVGNAKWNATVDALSHYRDDWRGAPFFTYSEALTYVGHKNALPPGFTEADLPGLVMHLGGDKYQLSHSGWAELRRLGAAVAS